MVTIIIKQLDDPTYSLAMVTQQQGPAPAKPPRQHCQQQYDVTTQANRSQQHQEHQQLTTQDNQSLQDQQQLYDVAFSANSTGQLQQQQISI